MPILQVRDIAFGYETKPVLSHVTFEVTSGEIIGIIGPNGSGKTTLLKIMDGLLFPQEGEVLVAGKNIRQASREELAGIIAFVPQEFSPVFPFSVREIVMMGRYPHLGNLRFEGSDDQDIVREAMEMTDTLALADRMIDQISGGERQRVLIARALAQKPEIILLDEATAFLDIKYQLAIFELIEYLNKNHDLTVMVVTHDINLAAQYTDRVVLLRGGTIYGMGTPEDIITETGIREVYDADVMVDKNPRTGAPRVTLLGRTYAP